MNVFQYRDAIRALLDAHAAGHISNENLSHGGAELEALYNAQPEHAKTTPYDDSPRIVSNEVVSRLRLADTIGTGSHLWAVRVDNEDWDGDGDNWLVRANDLGHALAQVHAQYGDTAEQDRPTSGDGVLIGEFAV